VTESRARVVPAQTPLRNSIILPGNLGERAVRGSS
jgi:hypothetical protein